MYTILIKCIIVLYLLCQSYLILHIVRPFLILHTGAKCQCNYSNPPTKQCRVYRTFLQILTLQFIGEQGRAAYCFWVLCAVCDNQTAEGRLLGGNKWGQSNPTLKPDNTRLFDCFTAFYLVLVFRLAEPLFTYARPTSCVCVIYQFRGSFHVETERPHFLTLANLVNRTHAPTISRRSNSCITPNK